MFTKLVLADTRPGRADSYKYSHYGDPAITGKAWIHPEVIEVWVKIAPAITDLRTLHSTNKEKNSFTNFVAKCQCQKQIVICYDLLAQ